MPRECIGQGIVIISLRGMNWHAGRFIDYKEIFIFIDDIQRKICRNDIFRGDIFHKLNGQIVIRVKNIPCMCPNSIQKDSVHRQLQVRNNLMGVPLCFQKVKQRGIIKFQWNRVVKYSFHLETPVLIGFYLSPEFIVNIICFIAKIRKSFTTF